MTNYINSWEWEYGKAPPKQAIKFRYLLFFSRLSCLPGARPASLNSVFVLASLIDVRETETLIKRWIRITFSHLIQHQRRNEAIGVPIAEPWSRQSDFPIVCTSPFLRILARCSVLFSHFRCFRSSKSCKILLMNLWRDWEYSHLYKFNYFILGNFRNSQRLTFGIPSLLLSIHIFLSVPSSSASLRSRVWLARREIHVNRFLFWSCSALFSFWIVQTFIYYSQCALLSFLFVTYLRYNFQLPAIRWMRTKATVQSLSWSTINISPFVRSATTRRGGEGEGGEQQQSRAHLKWNAKVDTREFKSCERNAIL